MQELQIATNYEVKKMNEYKQIKAWGIASLVSSIVGIILLLMPYFGLPCSIMALVFASKQNKLGNTGIATSGKIVGIIGIVLNSIVLLILLFVLMVFGISGIPV